MMSDDEAHGKDDDTSELKREDYVTELQRLKDDFEKLQLPRMITAEDIINLVYPPSEDHILEQIRSLEEWVQGFTAAQGKYVEGLSEAMRENRKFRHPLIK